MRPVKAWQGQIDSVVDGEIRSTMVPEDVWRTTSGNAETTKVIDRYPRQTRHDRGPARPRPQAPRRPYGSARCMGSAVVFRLRLLQALLVRRRPFLLPRA